MVREILLSVGASLNMTASTRDAGRDGDHNFTYFRVIKPSMLNAYQCRAEFRSGIKTGYKIITDETFTLHSSMARAGALHLQLVFVDVNSDIRGKTNILRLTIGDSINAINETDPDFRDGLAQLTDSSVSHGSYSGNVLALYNLAGEERFSAEIVGGGGSVGPPGPPGPPGETGPQGPPGESFDPADVLRIGALETSVSALQAEATAKWIILNDVDNRSRNSAADILVLQSTIGDINTILDRINGVIV